MNRLVPIEAGSPQETVCTMLSRFLQDGTMPPEHVAGISVLIFHGIQAFIDTGDPSKTESVFEPYIIARDYMVKHGAAQAYDLLVQEAAALEQAKDARGANIFKAAATILASEQKS